MSIDMFVAVVGSWLAQPPSPAPVVPDPAPMAPPGQLADAANTILAWMKWGGLVGAAGAFVAAGIMMAVGRRNRNSMAIEGATSLPWIVAGLACVLGSASVIAFFVQ